MTQDNKEWEREFVEQGANLEHERWSKWQAYLHSRLYSLSDNKCCHDHLKILPTELWQRWERQIKTPYSELSEAEKESDRKEARTYLPLVHHQLQKAREEEREKIYSAIEDYFISSYPIPDAKMLCGYIREALKETYMTTKI